MGILFDTSVLIALERSSGRVEKFIRGREREAYGISTITAAELLRGVHRAGSERARIVREAFVEKIIEAFPAYPFDLGAARIYGRIWAILAKNGQAVGAHDLIIGATCISLGFSLATLDVRDYSRIEGLRLEEI